MEDWALNMEVTFHHYYCLVLLFDHHYHCQFAQICDIVNSYEEGPAQAIKAIKRRLHYNCCQSTL